MYVEMVKQFSGNKKKQWKDLLESTGLTPQEEVIDTVLLWDDEKLAGAGSRDGNLLKYIAVAPEYQGEDLTSVILSHLRKEAFSQGINHLFLYTKPQNEKMFQSLFFYTVAKTKDVLLMENRKDGILEFLNGLAPQNVSGKVGAIVMNANPFTLGHRYLIETASKECDYLYVFVVSEDKSKFSAKDRMEMVKLGTADLENVKVLPTGAYLVSSATFPTYFLKEREKATSVQCSLDVEIFKNYFAPKFSINCRFLGTEPFSPMTNQYNKALKSGLYGSGIDVLEIERIEVGGMPVSASRVRSLIDSGDLKEISRLVPKTTFEFLKNKGYI